MMGAAQMSTRRALICSGLIACGLASACRGPSADRQETRTASREAQATFVGKTWISTDPSAARGVVTPAPTTYGCGAETFSVAFEEQRAYVTMPDGSLVTCAAWIPKATQNNRALSPTDA
jgi:hypothetical protein